LNTLPCNALISAYQENIKQFCESESVERDNDAVFRGKPAIIFWKENKETEYITFVIFNPDTKRYVSSYKMQYNSPKALEYKSNKVLGVTE
jgi:transposase-like protein